MSRRIAILFQFFLLVLAQPVQVDAEPAHLQQFLNGYCVKCHGPEKPKADLNLTVLSEGKVLIREAKLWENVVKQVNEREMPPKNKPQPPEEEREKFVTALTDLLANPDPSLIPPDPGGKPLHRLNHEEYENTIRDLFGVEFKAAQRFPADGSGGGGFDNNAGTLFVPPLLFEKYLLAAEEILEKTAPSTLFIAKPGMFTSSSNAAEKILKYFAARVFRRPVGRSELTGFLQVYQKAVGGKTTHEEAVKLALRGVLVSPYFIFRIEGEPEGGEPKRINDYELAARLSYFLWSSMPDEELRRLAAQKRLHEPGVLTKQVRRMVADPKARDFSESFVGQWLNIRNLHTSAKPDPKKFPEYSEKTRDGIYREPVELFHFLLTENKSLLDLLSADYAILNEEVAKIYGLEKVKGESFRKVSLNDPNRGGVLTMPAVLTLTSYPLRTSPVLRGKWILEEIIGTPPPPPPPIVASLPPDDRAKNGLTLRQRLEKHREDPTCANCHKKMDPLGFALENFDPIGRWRTEIAGDPVDATGEMTNGEKISSPADLKRALLERKEQFLRNLTERMLAYALGRGLEYYDIPTVKKITDSVAKSDFSSQTLIQEIVQSYPFQFRRGEQSELSQK